jgi:hypothetical protein
MFDSSRVYEKYPSKTSKYFIIIDEIGAALHNFREYFESLQNVVKRYLDISSRHWVELSEIFRF